MALGWETLERTAEGRSRIKEYKGGISEDTKKIISGQMEISGQFIF